MTYLENCRILLITTGSHKIIFFAFQFVTLNIRRVSGNNPNVSVQLDVFDEQRECDEAQSLQGPRGINLNSHLDVFYTILGQVNFVI